MNKLIAIEIVFVAFTLGCFCGSRIETDRSEIASNLFIFSFWMSIIVAVGIAVAYWLSL